MLLSSPDLILGFCHFSFPHCFLPSLSPKLTKIQTKLYLLKFLYLLNVLFLFELTFYHFFPEKKNLQNSNFLQDVFHIFLLQVLNRKQNNTFKPESIHIASEFNKVIRWILIPPFSSKCHCHIALVW